MLLPSTYINFSCTCLKGTHTSWYSTFRSFSTLQISKERYSTSHPMIISRWLSFHGEEVKVYVSRIKRKSISTIDIRREETFAVPFRDKISVFY